MTRRLAIAALLSATLAAAVALATPFGGDDGTANVPSDPGALKYEGKVGNLLAKFQKCVIKCHVNRAALKYPDDAMGMGETLEDGCESVCAQKYDAKATALGTAPDGATCVNTQSIRNLWVATLDAQSNQIFCDGTTPVVPGDDTTKIPSSPAILACEKKLASIVAKLLKCQAKCHLSRAKGKIADETGEESCEDATCVTAKYSPATAALVGCPGCLNFATLASNSLANGDNNAGLVYCAP
jgi:hypothetical protein